MANKWVKRYVIVGGIPRQKTMAVVDDMAIFYPPSTRHGRRKTLDYMKADETYVSRDAALAAMAGEKGFAVRGRMIFPATRRTGPDGARILYSRNGETVWGHFHPTRKEAEAEILAEVTADIAELRAREKALRAQLKASWGAR
jgi:hypothetical protein